MKKSVNKFFTLLLALCLAVGLFSAMSMTTFAEESIGDVLIWATKLGRTSNASYANSIKNIYVAMGATATYSITEAEQHFTGKEKLADNYDLIVIFLPSVTLTDEDITALKAFIDAGGRICFQAEWPDYASSENTVMSDAASKLGATFSITNDVIAHTNPTHTINTASSIMKDVKMLSPSAAARIEYTQPAEWLGKSTFKDDSTKSGAWLIDQAASKGRLTIFSDVNFYDDVTDDVTQFFKNLLTNAQANKKIVKDGGNPNDNFGEVPKATVSDVSIGGTKGMTVNSEITVDVKNDTFKEIKAGTDVSEWFNLPAGLKATVKNDVANAATKAIIVISGTVSENKNDKFSVTIPATALNSNKSIVVAENKKAVIVEHKCADTLVKTPEKAATTESDGNIEYYTCTLCNKIYKDAAGTQEITLADTVAPKLVDSNPKTADNCNSLLYVVITFTALCAVALVVFRKKNFN